MGLRSPSELQSGALVFPPKFMMKPGQQILTVVHQETSTPGFLGRNLLARGYSLDQYCPCLGDVLPEDLSTLTLSSSSAGRKALLTMMLRESGPNWIGWKKRYCPRRFPCWGFVSVRRNWHGCSGQKLDRADTVSSKLVIGPWRRRLRAKPSCLRKRLFTSGTRRHSRFLTGQCIWLKASRFQGRPFLTRITLMGSNFIPKLPGRWSITGARRKEAAPS